MLTLNHIIATLRRYADEYRYNSPSDFSPEFAKNIAKAIESLQSELDTVKETLSATESDLINTNGNLEILNELLIQSQQSEKVYKSALHYACEDAAIEEDDTCGEDKEYILYTTSYNKGYYIAKAKEENHV